MKQVLRWKNLGEVKMKDKIVIIGASGHGKVIADIAKLNGYQEIIFLDDDISKHKNGLYDVVGTSKDIESYKDEYDCIIAIGNNTIREKIYHDLKGIKQTVLIHPSAVIDKTVVIEEGTVVMANAVVNAAVIIKKCCIINTSATIDHDSIIEDFVHVSPGVHIAGIVHVGTRTWIGTGSSVVNNLIICNDCIIGAGSTVVKDIKTSGTYVGCPIRKVK